MASQDSVLINGKPVSAAWLVDQYQNRSTANIAGELNCCKKTISKYLHLLGSPLRTPGLPVHEHSWIFSQEQHEVIEGLLLSDANLHVSPRCRYPRFSVQLTGSDDLIGLIQAKFSQIPFARNIRLARRQTRGNGKILNSNTATGLVSPVCVSWEPYWRRWYPEGVKIIPSDFRVTPTTLRWAFYGDGTTSFCTGSRRNLVELALCMNGFTRADNEALRHKLALCGVDMRVKNWPILLRSSKSSVVGAFLQYIGDCEVASMQYKWKWPQPKPVQYSTWIIQHIQSGKTAIVAGLNRWCMEHSLSSASMRKVAKGIYHQHKGWWCTRTNEGAVVSLESAPVHYEGVSNAHNG